MKDTISIRVRRDRDGYRVRTRNGDDLLKVSIPMTRGACIQALKEMIGWHLTTQSATLPSVCITYERRRVKPFRVRR